jgi:hypothetical protein
MKASPQSGEAKRVRRVTRPLHAAPAFGTLRLWSAAPSPS